MSDLNSKQIIKTYNNIYKNKYNFKKNEVLHFEKNLNKNLKEMKIKNKNITVLNTGTGLEAYVFWKKGFKKIYLVDINPRGLLLNNLGKKKFKNIIVKKLNIVKDPLVISKKRIKVDLAYYQGVTHHFSNPSKGIINIIKSIKVNGIFFMRNYASGSLNFFMIDLVRKFIKFEFLKKFNKIYPKIINKLIIKNIKNISHKDKVDAIYYFKTFCGDHFFVPNLYLLDANTVHKFLISNGLKRVFKFNKKKYFFNDKSLGNSNISFIYKKVKEEKENFKVKLIHIDQNKIKFKEKFILSFIKRFNQKLQKISKLKIEKQIELAINLLFYVDLKRYFNSYPKKKIIFKNKKIIKNNKYLFNQFSKLIEEYSL